MNYALYSSAWNIVLPADDDDPDTHILPLFGPPHLGHMGCWCEPKRDLEEADVIVHNAVH